jgi:hypothetical protein
MFEVFAENPGAQRGFAQVFPEGPAVILEWRSGMGE